jgi:N-acetylmuramoyl-L-alanine amidase
VGSGDARLAINDVQVPVLPNGSFLAWLPLPDRERPVYRFVVARGGDTVRADHRIRRPAVRVPLPLDGPLVVDTASLSPVRGEWRMAGDPVVVRLRAPMNARVAFEGSATYPMVADAAGWWATEVPARLLPGASVVVRRGADSVRLHVSPPTLLDPDRPRYGALGAAPATIPDTDRVVIARPVQGGTYKWFLLPGTTLPLVGRSGGAWQVQLDKQLSVWVDSVDVRPLDPGTAPPRRVVGNGRVVAGRGWVDLVLPVSTAPAHAVEVTPRGLELVLHGVTANTDIVNYASADSMVERVTWEQAGEDRARFVVDTREPVWGWMARYERGAFVLRIRRPPAVDRTRPLAGLKIAVDAGHPPAGSTGPTGLYEAVATLAIAERLRGLLEARGAQVVMTRTSPAALGLAERVVTARRADAHVFVSIHLNALPDGVNPFRAHGTGTYFFTGHSVALARAVQLGMVRQLGLRDLGVNYDNLAVVRGTWMPSVLCEGAFLMIPEQEAALRTPEYQDRYAAGVADGLDAYFRSLARP